MSRLHSIEESAKSELKSVPATEGSGAATALTPSQAQNEPPSSKKLTADEQMALYEKALKEDDWGHQPC